MSNNILYIKNMVCRRCILAVTRVFEDNGIAPLNVELGKVVLADEVPQETMDRLRNDLEVLGFELIDDKRMRLLEQIRVGIIEYVHTPEWQEKMKLSDYLQEKCLHEYSFLSKLFTEMKGVSIEHFCIAQRIELVKELLVYDELSVSEIAAKLHYSSVAHLSGQFKTVTGLSPTQFKQLNNPKRRALDEI